MRSHLPLPDHHLSPSIPLTFLRASAHLAAQRPPLSSPLSINPLRTGLTRGKHGRCRPSGQGKSGQALDGVALPPSCSQDSLRSNFQSSPRPRSQARPLVSVLTSVPRTQIRRGRPLGRVRPEEGGGVCSRPPHRQLGVRSRGERGPLEVRAFAGAGPCWAGGLLPGEREGSGGPGGRNSWAGPAAASLRAAFANKARVKFGEDVVSDRGSVPRSILPRLEGSSAASHPKAHEQRGESWEVSASSRS